MQAKGHLVQIAFELETGGIDERLILRVPQYRGLIEMRVRAQRPEVEVENAV